MTAQNRTTLKAAFETGDVPTGSDYADLIDSSLNLVETSAQSIASPVTFSNTLTITGNLAVDSLTVSAAATVGSMVVQGTMTVSGAVTAGSANIAGGAIVVGAVTAGSVGILGALRVSAATSLEGATTIGGTLAVVTAETTATASGAVGGSTVPTTATKYLKVQVSGVTYNIALYPSV